MNNKAFNHLGQQFWVLIHMMTLFLWPFSTQENRWMLKHMAVFCLNLAQPTFNFFQDTKNCHLDACKLYLLVQVTILNHWKGNLRVKQIVCIKPQETHQHSYFFGRYHLSFLHPDPAQTSHSSLSTMWCNALNTHWQELISRPRKPSEVPFGNHQTTLNTSLDLLSAEN